MLKFKTTLTALLLSTFFLNSSCSLKTNKTNKSHFTFNLPREIHSLDPLLIRGTAKRFILFNLHRGLFYYNKENKLTAHGASSCSWKTQLTLRCRLSDKKWSDGSLIRSSHYLNTYSLIKSQNEESGTFLTNIKNLVEDNGDLIFTLKKVDKDFRHELTNIYFKPRKEKKLYKTFKEQVFSGPYKLKKITKSFIELENNTFFNEVSRPLVKGVFIDDPNAALNLYLMGKIDFLRYLETSNIPKYPERYRAPFARLDGIFFSLKHMKDESLRKALLYSLDFTALKKIFYSPSMPGCLSLPKFFFKSELPCYKMDLDKARLFQKKIKQTPKNLTFYIPSMPSDEHKKLAQWARESWRSNLGIEVNIEQMEPGTFYESVKQGRLAIYRKSVSLKNLTCREAKEIVLTQPEFIELNKNLKTGLELSCDKFFNSVLEKHVWIPLGMPSFAHLHAKDYSGYYINMLGQFGLEDLTKKVSNLNEGN